MSYLAYHHDSYYFQIRVPAALVARFGPIVRTHLQTKDRAEAKLLALRLASDWLARFHVEQRSAGAAGPVQDGVVEHAVPALEVAHASQLVPGCAAGVAASSGDAGGAKPMTPARASGSEPVGASAEAVPSSAPGAQSAQAAVLTDDALFAAWHRLDTGRSPSTLKEMRSALSAFRRFTRKPLGEITRVDVSGYRDKLLRMGLARKTVSKRVGSISTLLQVAFDAGWLPQNVARGLKVPRADVPTLVRRTFTADELRRLFELPVYRNGARPIGAGGEACVWIPMIALNTGARLEEMAQLRADDILLDREFGPLIRITDEGEDQRLKTGGSRRIIPMHPELASAGFIDYLESVRDAGHAWLFPALEPDHDGRRGANFGKWFMRQIRSRRGLGIADPRLVFHSFRHTFKTLCRAAGIAEELHDALTGHVSASVSRRYGEMPLGPLVEAVRRIALPVQLPCIEGGVRHD